MFLFDVFWIPRNRSDLLGSFGVTSSPPQNWPEIVNWVIIVGTWRCLFQFVLDCGILNFLIFGIGTMIPSWMSTRDEWRTLLYEKGFGTLAGCCIAIF